MLKSNWKKIIISCLFTLSPMFFGLIVWNKLPEVMSTHWGINGTADGTSSRAFVVFGMPAILVTFNILCMIITSFDKKNKDQNKKAFNIIFYILPITSIICNYIMYAAAFGKLANMSVIMALFLGFGLILIGNLMPKVKHNRTLGIKIPWTLQSKANWNATHRFGGKVWVVCGLLTLLTALLPETWMFITFFVILFSSMLIISVYSYRFYKREKGE